MGINSTIEQLREDYDHRYNRQPSMFDNDVNRRFRSFVSNKIVRYSKLRWAFIIQLLSPVVLIVTEYSGMLKVFCCMNAGFPLTRYYVSISISLSLSLMHDTVLDWQEAWITSALNQFIFLLTVGYTIIILGPYARLDGHYCSIEQDPTILLSLQAGVTAPAPVQTTVETEQRRREREAELRQQFRERHQRIEQERQRQRELQDQHEGRRESGDTTHEAPVGIEPGDIELEIVVDSAEPQESSMPGGTSAAPAGDSGLMYHAFDEADSDDEEY